MSSQSADPASGVVSWITLAAANTIGWLNGEFAGQLVTFASVLVFGAIAVYSRVAQAIDARRIRDATLPIRIKIEAERLEAEAKANAGTGEHVTP